MSDKEWYEGLSMGELPGKHVHVVFSNATMDGCLNLHGEIPYWAEDDDLKYVQILEQGHDQVWRTAVGVESVSLVWDERDWEEIPIEDIQRGDTIVVNGRLLHLDPDAVITMTSGGRIFPVFTVSCALRRRHKLPTEPGFYRDGDGALYFLSTLAEFWVMETPEKWDCMLGLPEASKTLTPVHFVDGRAE